MPPLHFIERCRISMNFFIQKGLAEDTCSLLDRDWIVKVRESDKADFHCCTLDHIRHIHTVFDMRDYNPAHGLVLAKLYHDGRVPLWERQQRPGIHFEALGWLEVSCTLVK